MSTHQAKTPIFRIGRYSVFREPSRGAPYLKPNRLGDVMAAIQTMATYDKYKNDCSEWSHRISGDESKAAHWKSVFIEHPEFFRRSSDDEELYSLVWRRALPRRYDRRKRKEISDAQYESLLDKTKDRYISRRPLEQSEIKMLIDTAVSMHNKAAEQQRDWRWWIAPAAALVGTMMSAALAFIAAWQFRRIGSG